MIYNKTQLNPEKVFEKHIFHRDQFAHYLRWTHVLKRAKIGMNILDFGCGNGNLAEVLYRNKFKANMYLGLDIREKTCQNARERFPGISWIKFEHTNLCSDLNSISTKNNKWDIICSFEVIEHIGKKNIDAFLKNIKSLCSENTTILISTPNYDEKVGAAENHIINGEVGEWKHEELQEKLKEYFTITEKYGTFASQKDYKNLMNDWQKEMYNNLSKYYDSNILSNLMAPMFPVESRNCLWVCKI